MVNKVSIIIPNWNGRDFLSRCVGSVLQSATESGTPFELLLMDDASTDGSAVETAAQFPEVRLVRNDQNYGFGHTVNSGAQLASGEVLVFVNNDLIPRAGFIERLIQPLASDSNIFGVSGKTVDWDAGAPNHVNMTGGLDSGHLQLRWSDDDVATETMFMQGGSCAVRRDLFLELGGFCSLYAPAYWEDYDISYQALKAGYRNIYEPAAVGSHLGQGSMIRAYGHDQVALMKLRNRLLFLVLNLTDDDQQRAFWAQMPGFVRNSPDGRFKHRLQTLLYFLQHNKAIKEERARRAAQGRLADREIFERFAQIGQPCL